MDLVAGLATTVGLSLGGVIAAIVIAAVVVVGLLVLAIHA